jgi:hypothetical protein
MQDEFYTLEPEQFPALALDSYEQDSLHEMAYFLWCLYPEDYELMKWRRDKLLPLLHARADSEAEDED